MTNIQRVALPTGQLSGHTAYVPEAMQGNAALSLQVRFEHVGEAGHAQLVQRVVSLPDLAFCRPTEDREIPLSLDGNRHPAPGFSPLSAAALLVLLFAPCAGGYCVDGTQPALQRYGSKPYNQGHKPL